MARLTQQQLETHLWGAATILRGRTAGQDYKTYILSLMFFKRLSDQWDYEGDEKIKELERDRGEPFSDVHRAALRSTGAIHRFTLPEDCHWNDVLQAAQNIGEVLTKAMRGIADANKELVGVFTVDWNQPAPDGKGKLIANNVVHALVQHFHTVNLSNASVEPDIIGRAYEYLIKQFADDAGAKAGEFFTPPEVVDVLVRILEPQPGETIYDPTCGSGGMLVHSADFVKEKGHRADQVRYRGQEMNWSTYAIARINMILHGLEGDIRGGKSTLSDPLFLKPDGSLDQFNIVLANFPFSDEMWWLPEDQRTEEQAKKAKKQLGKEGFQDKYHRFVFGNPPASYGDYAFIQHIIASANSKGRCGIVCPQGVLFRGQPEIEEETGEFDDDGNPKMRRRKADDEYLIRKGILDARLIDAVIALPLNIFYGAGVPACLLILRKDRPAERRDKILLLYAARHYRELSNKNQLRPQDVMRILVHYHAYGDAQKAGALVALHGDRLQRVVSEDEIDEVGLVTAEFAKHATKLEELEAQLTETQQLLGNTAKKTERAKLEGKVKKLQAAIEKQRKELAKRDEQIAEARKRAEEERQAIHGVGEELVALYAEPSALVKHARVVDFAEIEENEFNLNIARYVDTFDPEDPINVNQALVDLDRAEEARQEADRALRQLLALAGYSGEAKRC
jgi:type I restriction enzyme M protein